MSNADDNLSSCMHAPAVCLEARIVFLSLQLRAFTSSSVACATAMNKVDRLNGRCPVVRDRKAPSKAAGGEGEGRSKIVYQILDSSILLIVRTICLP